MTKALLVLCLLSQFTFAASKPVPSGTVKAYKGPEGELITVLEVNEGKEVLAHFKGVKGEMNGQTHLLKINAMGEGKQEYYRSVKKGSKTRDIPVMEGGNGSWRFLQPGVENWLPLKYSEAESEKASKDTLLNNYKP